MSKKLILIFVFVITFSFPCIALASDAQPSDGDYMINLDPSTAINYTLFKEDYTKLIDRYIGFGESQYITSAFGSLAMVAVEYDFTSALRPYFGLMSTSSNVWFKFDAEFIQFTDPSPLGSDMTIYTAYDVGNGYTQRTVLSGYTIDNGDNVLNSPVYNLGSQFLNAENLNYLTIQQRINLYMNPDRLHDYEFIAQSFSLIVYIEGVSGSDVGLYLVIDGGFKDINESLTDLKSEVNAMQGQLGNIDNSINQGFDNVTNKQDTIIDKVSSGFANIGNQVKKAVTDAVTELFVPSEEDMVAQYDKWDSLMADRFGAVYESSQIIDNFVESIKVTDTQDIINFPVVSVDLVGTTFEFGGWEVDVVPDGFQWLVDILKTISNIGCTVLFIDGMRSRYESVVK